MGGGAGLDFVFHMFFLVKYCKALEEGSFRSRSADFLWMLLFGEFVFVQYFIKKPAHGGRKKHSPPISGALGAVAAPSVVALRQV